MQKKCRGFGSEGILRKEKSVHSPLLKITAFEHRDYQREAAFSESTWTTAFVHPTGNHH